jgi:glucose-6-phosphate isomerase
MIEPFSKTLDLRSGILLDADQVIRRNLGDMASYYSDHAAVELILESEGNRLIYEVQGIDLPETEGLVLYGTTTIFPGRIGDEYHMTKGHYHAKLDRAEVYICLCGEGYLVLQDEQRAVRGVPMRPGTIAYVPPMWAHRTANVGDEPFSFLAVWPGDAGHDYGSIEKSGFTRRLVNRNGQPEFTDAIRRTGHTSKRGKE